MEPIRTPLYEEHRRLGGHLVDFAGHWLPVQYTSILEEAAHVRRAAGLFDLCHMGRVRFTGRDAVALADRLVTRAVSRMTPGMVRYALLTREDGSCIDDVLVYREPDSVFLCINAGNRNRDLAWFRAHAAGTDAGVEDLSAALAMIAVQGPRSLEVARAVCTGDPGRLGYYRFANLPLVVGCEALVSRTGYTGEDGFEFCFPAEAAPALWQRMLEAGEGFLRPIGLGARDTLRLEAGMPLYGHELDDSTTPVEANLGAAVDAGHEFVGAEAVREFQRRGTSRRLVGFAVKGRRVPRQGYAVLDGAAAVGQVCSGTWSPTLDKAIGTAYVVAGRSSPGTTLSVDFRGSPMPIEIVEMPFYKRERASANPPGGVTQS